MDGRELRSTIREICSKTLLATIDLEEFFNSWPDEADESSLLRLIYNDLEDAIEHTPGYFFKRGVNYALWNGSPPYLDVHLDYILLGYDKTDEELLECREYVLSMDHRTEELQIDAVAKYFEEG